MTPKTYLCCACHKIRYQIQRFVANSLVTQSGELTSPPLRKKIGTLLKRNGRMKLPSFLPLNLHLRLLQKMLYPHHLPMEKRKKNGQIWRYPRDFCSRKVVRQIKAEKKRAETRRKGRTTMTRTGIWRYLLFHPRQMVLC